MYMAKLTREEIRKRLDEAREKGVVKPEPIKIPKNIRYDRITIAKLKTWERLGIWLDDVVDDDEDE